MLERPVKVLVPISGGKDSQACLELALAHHELADIRGLFCDDIPHLCSTVVEDFHQLRVGMG